MEKEEALNKKVVEVEDDLKLQCERLKEKDEALRKAEEKLKEIEGDLSETRSMSGK